MDYPGKVITKTQVTPTQTSASGNWTLDDQAAAIKNNNWPVALVPNPISKSLRFNSADTAYLNRTPATAGNRRTFTWSGWVKRCNPSTTNTMFAADVDATNFFAIWFREEGDNGRFEVLNYSTTYDLRIETTQVFRDVSAWYHVVVAIDTTQATSTNRVKIYINGSQVTALSTTTYPSQNFDTDVNTTNPHKIGVQASSYGLHNGYLAEVNFIDGQALTPSSFGMTNPQTGQWIPLKYSGTYGTNGFYLNFKDATSTTTLGYDYSGNANNWTTNNFSVTAGAGNDSLTDVPTPWFAYNTTGDVGGVIRGNYATWNPLDRTAATYTNGNLEVSSTSSAAPYNMTTTIQLPTSGKWYCEVTALKGANSPLIGIGNNRPTDQIIGYRSNATYISANVTGVSSSGTPATWTTGDIIGIAYDAGAGTLSFYKNGSAQSGGFTSIPATGYCVAVRADSASGDGGTLNAGQRPFAYTPPTGFRSLCTTNLPATAIGFGLTNQGDDYFNPVLYTGTGAARSITGVGFAPNFVWIKVRDAAYDHQLYDIIRGAGKYLYSNSTVSEQTDINQLSSFDSDGFSLGSAQGTNESAKTFVAWNWKAAQTLSKTYAVTVVSSGGNKYRFDGFAANAVTLELSEGGTFRFDQSDASNSGHPFRFSTTSDGTHGGGVAYTTGVTVVGTPGTSGAYTEITVAASAPTLYYYCTVHSGMGGQANTPTTNSFSNLTGTIQSNISPNTTAGFSIVTYTGTGTNGATVGHGLGVVPDMIIVKRRNSTGQWATYHRSVGNTGALRLNTTSATITDVSFWNNTSPTSTVFTIGVDGDVNTNTGTYVAYCFAAVPGYSAFGSYTGNGSTDGPFIYLGFRPKFVMFKSTGVQDWVILDSARDTYNVAGNYLRPNSSGAENGGSTPTTSTYEDFLSNGIKLRNNASSSGYNNTNGVTYIYAAFAESPFQFSNAR